MFGSMGMANNHMLSGKPLTIGSILESEDAFAKMANSDAFRHRAL